MPEGLSARAKPQHILVMTHWFWNQHMLHPLQLSPEDFFALNDLLARYCWCFDSGDADGYASLWTGEGELTGFGDPVRGTDALRKLLQDSYASSQGKLRHLLMSVTLHRGADGNSATAKGYNLVTRWNSDGSLIFNVEETFELRRTAEGWRLLRVHLELMQ
jgi:hypothetical protein